MKKEESESTDLAHGVLMANGGGGGTSAAAVSARSVELRCESLVYWKRMMSTAAETAVEQREKKDSSVTKEKEKGLETKEKESSVPVASSYWGISRPKITREDGTEWRGLGTASCHGRAISLIRRLI